MSRLPDELRDIFADVYRYYEEIWDMPDTVEAWTAAAQKIGPLCAKHENKTLIGNLLMACLETIDEQYRVVRNVLNEPDLSHEGT